MQRGHLEMFSVVNVMPFGLLPPLIQFNLIPVFLCWQGDAIRSCADVPQLSFSVSLIVCRCFVICKVGVV